MEFFEISTYVNFVIWCIVNNIGLISFWLFPFLSCSCRHSLCTDWEVKRNGYFSTETVQELNLYWWTDNQRCAGRCDNLAHMNSLRNFVWNLHRSAEIQSCTSVYRSCTQVDLFEVSYLRIEFILEFLARSTSVMRQNAANNKNRGYIIHKSICL